jgi:hypothetical protein
VLTQHRITSTRKRRSPKALFAIAVPQVKKRRGVAALNRGWRSQRIRR